MQLTESEWLTHVKGWTKRVHLKPINTLNEEPTKALDSKLSLDNISKISTSDNLTKADLAWHAVNTYGFDCSEVISKGEITKEGYFLITCVNNLKLKVHPRKQQHPSIVEYTIETDNPIEQQKEQDIVQKEIERIEKQAKESESAQNEPSIETDNNNKDIQTSLVNALRLNKETSERLGESGKAIQAYMRKGMINKKPNKRLDYTDYYLLKKPAKFMGHDLALIEEEYMSEWVGCCVSEGAGVTVKVVGNIENLEQFAIENGCSLSDKVDLQQNLIDLGPKLKVLPKHYASLSCRERDKPSSN